MKHDGKNDDGCSSFVRHGNIIVLCRIPSNDGFPATMPLQIPLLLKPLRVDDVCGGVTNNA